MVQRKAVLEPLWGPHSYKDVPKLTLKTQDAWRDRVDQLVEAGWEKVLESAMPETQLGILINCRPTFVVPNLGNVRCCRVGVACPFCWARWSLDVWNSFSWSLFDEPGVEADQLPDRPILMDDKPDVEDGRRSGLDVVERVLKSGPIARIINDPQGSRPRRSLDYEAEIRSGRRTVPGPCGGMRPTGRPLDFRLAGQLGIQGGYEVFRVAEISESSWRVEVHQLFVAPKSLDFEHEATRKWLWLERSGLASKAVTVRRIPSPTRSRAVEAVAGLCAYWPVMLKSAPADALEIMDVRRRYKLMQSFGCVRNKASRDRGAEEATVGETR